VYQPLYVGQSHSDQGHGDLLASASLDAVAKGHLTSYFGHLPICSLPTHTRLHRVHGIDWIGIRLTSGDIDANFDRNAFDQPARHCFRTGGSLTSPDGSVKFVGLLAT
jgi:hypothetical protein